jgi:short-subunit dehydrogenase
MPIALVIGASRGHGLELTKALHDDGYKVYGTIRASSATDALPVGTFFIPDIDLEKADSGEKIANALEDAKLDLVIFNAGLYKAEDINNVDFEDEVSMYKTVAIAPVVIAHHL